MGMTPAFPQPANLTQRQPFPIQNSLAQRVGMPAQPAAPAAPAAPVASGMPARQLLGGNGMQPQPGPVGMQPGMPVNNTLARPAVGMADPTQVQQQQQQLPQNNLRARLGM